MKRAKPDRNNSVKSGSVGELLPHLPAVDRLKGELAAQHPHWPDALATQIAREAVDGAREKVRVGRISDVRALLTAVAAGIAAAAEVIEQPSMRPLLNGTGVLVHTNAGRAPLSDAALAALARLSGGYCNLELDLASGRRGSRHDHLRPMLRWLCGAQDALVVNNNAAAVMLVLHALAHGRPVLVSRGELVEIGGSFRVPEVMQAAGARLVEVGTTNRTRVADYARAAAELTDAGDPPAALMQIHRSNFRIEGFVQTPDVGELATLADKLGVPLISDLGSGAVAPPSAVGLSSEPTVADTLAAGAHIATFSGDKLIGGPQAGIIVGREHLVRRLAADPMARAVRIGSLTIAALDATLRAHLLGRAAAEVPVLRAAALSLDDVRATAIRCADALGCVAGLHAEVIASSARVGGGSQPGVDLASTALALSHPSGANRLSEGLRLGSPAILGRIRDDRVLLDVRSLLATTAPADLAPLLVAALQVAVTR